VKCPILLSDFDENWNVLTNFNDISNIEFYKNYFNQYRIVTCVRTDRRMKLSSRRSCGVAPNENYFVFSDKLLCFVTVVCFCFSSSSYKSSQVFLVYICMYVCMYVCCNSFMFVGDVMFCAWLHRAEIAICCIMLHL
jgi:hypothetical protein